MQKKHPKIERLTVGDLTPDDHNANRHTVRGQGMVERSLQVLGAGRSILLDKNNRIIAGNLTAEVAGSLGIQEVLVVETTGNQLVAVRRTDVDLDSPTGRGLAVADNRTSEVSLAWDAQELLAMDAPILDDFFLPDELSSMAMKEMATMNAAPALTPMLETADDTRPAPKPADRQPPKMVETPVEGGQSPPANLTNLDRPPEYDDYDGLARHEQPQATREGPYKPTAFLCPHCGGQVFKEHLVQA